METFSMKKIGLVLIAIGFLSGLLFSYDSCWAQGNCVNIAGDWTGTVTDGVDVYRLILHLSQDICNVTGTADSPDSCPGQCGMITGPFSAVVSGNIVSGNTQSPWVDCDTCQIICYGRDYATLTIDGNTMSGTGQTEDCEDGGYYDVQFAFTRTSNCPIPGTPSNPSPSNGATGVSTSLTISWASCANADSYDVYFGTSSNPSLVGNTTITSYSLSSLSNSTTYYWKIVAKNNCGNSTPGAVWSFTTGFGPGPGLALCLYDDFSGPYIERRKWREGETTREINNGKLVLKDASPNPVTISGYPYFSATPMNFTDPSSVISIQAVVTVLEYSITGSTLATTKIGGRWYNDGTPGAFGTGDVWAEVSISDWGPGLTAKWFIGKFNSSTGLPSDIVSGSFTTPVTVGSPYTLYIGYSSIKNEFTFKLGPEVVTYGPDGLPARVGDAASAYKTLQAATMPYNTNSWGYIEATFDNVQKNGAPYDDFSSSTIDQTKWTTYEFVREIANGKFRSKVRSSSASTSSITSELEFPSPSSVNIIQTEVTPLIFNNAQGASLRARIAGYYFNDGTSGGGYIGDVGAQVRIGGNGTNPIGEWNVWKCTDLDCNNAVGLAEGTFTTPITLGETYTLFLGWNGNQLTFRIDNEATFYTPTTTIKPSNKPWKMIGTQIYNPSGKEATIEALFDDVMVSVFNDITCGYWAYDHIMAIYDAGITTGYGDSRYGPEDIVTREQMATFIVRSVEGEPAENYCDSGTPFPDVSADMWSCKYIKRLKEFGITTGYQDGTYGPYDFVPREQMAAFLVRAVEGEPPLTYCDSGSLFTDVTPDMWSCRYIKRLKELGITTGYQDGTYGPYDLVTRAQMAVFLGRAFLGMK